MRRHLNPHQAAGSVDNNRAQKSGHFHRVLTPSRIAIEGGARTDLRLAGSARGLVGVGSKFVAPGVGAGLGIGSAGVAGAGSAIGVRAPEMEE